MLLHVLSILIAHFQSKGPAPTLSQDCSPVLCPPLNHPEQAGFCHPKASIIAIMWGLHLEVGVLRVLVSTED